MVRKYFYFLRKLQVFPGHQKQKKREKNANNHFRRDVIKPRLLKAWALCYFVWFVVEMTAVEKQRFQIDFFFIEDNTGVFEFCC